MTDEEYEKMSDMVALVHRLKLREQDINTILDMRWRCSGVPDDAHSQVLHNDMLRRGADVLKEGIRESIAALHFATDNSTVQESVQGRKMVLPVEGDSETRILPSEQRRTGQVEDQP